jgi:predicted CXXCH cytochrome family protein
MKKQMVFGLTLTLAFLLVGTAFSYTPGNGIKTTPHDLSSAGASIGKPYGSAAEQAVQDRICVYCHAPHHTIKASDAAALNYNYVPLWNHDLTTQAYTTYSAGTDIPGDFSRQAPGTNNPANPNIATVSLGSPTTLCLSCHDGTVATDAYGNAGGPSSGGYGSYNYSPSKSSGTQFIQNNAYQIGQGGDLTNHHPVGFSYFTAYTNSLDTAGQYALKAPTTPMGSTGRTIGQLLWKASWDPTSHAQTGGNMECTTCHSVHNKGNNGQRLLWVDDTNSALCLNCHNK